MLRKLCYYFEIRGNNSHFVDDQKVLIPDVTTGHEEVTLKIDIESAMRLKNVGNELEQPSTYVVLNLPFTGCNP